MNGWLPAGVLLTKSKALPMIGRPGGPSILRARQNAHMVS